MAAKKTTKVQKDRARRMKWWHEARFGMFVHWGLYSQLERHEWVMNRERIPVKEYEKLSYSFKPKHHPMREWAGLPKTSPDRIVGVTVIKIEFASRPAQKLGPGYVVI